MWKLMKSTGNFLRAIGSAQFKEGAKFAAK